MSVIRTAIAGYSHLKFAEREAYAGLTKGDRVFLVREPENHYDTYAIRVMQAGIKLGYVPMGDNKEIAQAMDADPDKPIRCECSNNPIVDKGKCIAQAKIVVTW